MWGGSLCRFRREIKRPYVPVILMRISSGSRQQIHRIIDVGLIALASVSGGVFLLAFGVIRHLGPRHAFWLEIAALAGFALSALIWLVVAVATPAPVTVLDAAKQGARRVHDRLPPEIRERLPEELRVKITGT